MNDAQMKLAYLQKQILVLNRSLKTLNNSVLNLKKEIEKDSAPIKPRRHYVNNLVNIMAEADNKGFTLTELANIFYEKKLPINPNPEHGRIALASVLYRNKDIFKKNKKLHWFLRE